MAIAEVKSVTNSCFINGSAAFMGQTIDYGDLIETYNIDIGLAASVKSDTINDDGILSLFFPADKSFMKIKPHIKTSFDSEGNEAWAGANLVKISPEDTELGTKVIPLGIIAGAAGPVFIQRNIKKYPEFKDKTKTGIEKISPKRKMAIYPDDKLLIGKVGWIKIEVAPFDDRMIQAGIENVLLLFRSGQNGFRFTKRSVEPLIKQYLQELGLLQSGIPIERLRYFEEGAIEAYFEGMGISQSGMIYETENLAWTPIFGPDGKPYTGSTRYHRSLSVADYHGFGKDEAPAEVQKPFSEDPFDPAYWIMRNIVYGEDVDEDGRYYFQGVKMQKGWEWRYDLTMAKEPAPVRKWKRKSGGKYYEAYTQGLYDWLFGYAWGRTDLDKYYLVPLPGSSAFENGEPSATLAVELTRYPSTTSIRAS